MKKQPETIYYVNASVTYFKERSYGLYETKNTQTSVCQVMARKIGDEVKIYYPGKLGYKKVKTMFVDGKCVSERVFKGMLKASCDQYQKNLFKSLK